MGGRWQKQAEQALAAAQWAFRFSRDRPYYARKLQATAVLFYELLMLHQLVDGNKRLATTMLWIFLKANRLPRPRNNADAALYIAAGEWSQEDVYRWLLREYHARRARGKRNG